MRLWYLLTLLGELAAAVSTVRAQPATTASPSVLTLPAAWQQAEAHNKTVELQRQQVAVSRELVKDRQNQRMPELLTRGQYSYLGGLIAYEPRHGLRNPEAVPVPPSPHAYTANLSGEWALYTGGRIRNQIQTQQLDATLENERLGLARLDVHLQVAEAYLDLRRNLDYQGLTQGNIRESERRLRQIQALFRNGVVLRTDVLRTELQLSRQQLLLTEIQNNITLANQRLNLLMGAPENQPNQPDTTLLPPEAVLTGSYEQYLAQAQGQAPELRIARLQSRLSELRLAATAVARRPQLGAFAGYGFTYPNRLVFPPVPQLYSVGEIGLRVSYNITARWLDRHAERAAELAVERQRLAEEQALDLKREEIKTAFVRFEEGLARIRIAEQNIRQATENYRIVNSTYFNQLALLTDLLDADNQLLQSRFDLVTAQVQAATQYYQLQKALGQLSP